MSKSMWLTVACLAGWVLPAAAHAASVQATIDRTEAALGDQLQLSITVEGSQLASPELPDLSPFEVHSAGTSRQFQFINGRSTSSVVFNYILVPKEAGTFTIGPAHVEVDGKRHSTRPFQVRIGGAAEPAPRQATDSGELFVTAKLSNETPYAGEQVVYTLRLYRRVRLAEANVSIPDFDGFLVETLGEQRDFNTVVRGQEYDVTELRRALFPTKSGELTIPAAELAAQVVTRRRGRGWFFDPFGGGDAQSQRQVVRSNPIQVKVRALPAAPADYSGLVGQFEASAQVSKVDLKVGESTTLTVTVSGTGNARSIPEPRLEGLEAFKSYDDKPASSLDTAGDMVRGSRTFRRSLVPLVAGELSIPGVGLTYFDPKEGSYRTARTQPTALRVLPSEGKEDLRLTELIGSQSGKVAVKVLADDIRPIYTGLDALSSPAWTQAVPVVFAGSALLPPLMFVGLAGSRRRREREDSDVGLRRRRTALKNARRALGDLRRAAPAALAVEASRLLRAFLGDALGIEGLALTPREAGDHLRRAGVAGNDAQTVETLLVRLEAAQYGAGALDAAAQKRLPADLDALMARLDKALPRQRAA